MEKTTRQPVQLKFTRLGEQRAGDGWQIVNDGTSNAPADARSAFSGLQNGNTMFLNRQRGYDGIVTELRTDNGWAFLTRIQYGLTDGMGRPSLFAHGFALPVSVFAADPEALLNIPFDAFVFASRDTASAQSLALDVTSGTAAGVSSPDLVYALYAALFGPQSDVLNIVCDCSETTIRNVMTVLYTMIPPSLRGVLTFSTAETNSGRPTVVLFSMQPLGKVNTINLTAGEVHASALVRQRYGDESFISHTIGLAEDARQRYLQQLDAEVSKLGTAERPRLDLYRFAHILVTDAAQPWNEREHDPQECQIRLGSICALYSIGGNRAYRNMLFEETLRTMLDRHYSIDMTLADTVDRILAVAQDDKMRALREDYRFVMIIGDGKHPEAGADRYARYYADGADATMVPMRNRLLQSEAGAAILRTYYVDRLGRRLQQEAIAGTLTEQMVGEYHAQIAGCEQRIPDTAKTIAACCNQLHVLGLTRTTICTTAWLDQILAFWESVLPENQQLQDSLFLALQHRYWERFDFVDGNWLAYGVDERLIMPSDVKAHAVSMLRPAYLELLNAYGDKTACLQALAAIEAANAQVDADASRAASHSLLDAYGALQCERRLHQPFELDLLLDLWRVLASETPVVEFLQLWAQRYAMDALNADHMQQAFVTVNQDTLQWLGEQFIQYLCDHPESEYADAALKAMRPYLPARQVDDESIGGQDGAETDLFVAFADAEVLDSGADGDSQGVQMLPPRTVAAGEHGTRTKKQGMFGRVSSLFHKRPKRKGTVEQTGRDAARNDAESLQDWEVPPTFAPQREAQQRYGHRGKRGDER